MVHCLRLKEISLNSTAQHSTGMKILDTSGESKNVEDRKEQEMTGEDRKLLSPFQN